jgi:hypothetical protein
LGDLSSADFRFDYCLGNNSFWSFIKKSILFGVGLRYDYSVMLTFIPRKTYLGNFIATCVSIFLQLQMDPSRAGLPALISRPTNPIRGKQPG